MKELTSHEHTLAFSYVVIFLYRKSSHNHHTTVLEVNILIEPQTGKLRTIRIRNTKGCRHENIIEYVVASMLSQYRMRFLGVKYPKAT